MDLQDTASAAKRLGIRLTCAEEGTDIYERWADGVAQAMSIASMPVFDMAAYNAFTLACRSANTYAVWGISK